MTEPTQNDTDTAHRIAICNQKGGVSKSTLTVNLGGALNERGHNVLLIDTDPQGHLSAGVGLDDAYDDAPPSLYDALLDPHNFHPEDGNYSLQTDIINKSHEEFDVITSNIDMFSIEQELTTAMRGRERLNQLLNYITHDYDFIVVDTPPSLGQITDNVLLAANNLVIPVEAEDTSIRALELLNEQIGTLETEYSITITERAVVPSNVDYPLDTEQREMLEWFEDTYKDICPVHEVRNRAAIKRAWNAGVSIFKHTEECDQRDSLLNLARTLETNTDTTEVIR